MSQSSHWIPRFQVLADLISYDSVKNDYPFLDCIISRESSWNKNAVGKAGEIGLLQFMPATFREYCVEKYGLKDDIKNPEIQLQCAKMMWDKGLIFKWTSSKRCL